MEGGDESYLQPCYYDKQCNKYLMSTYVVPALCQALEIQNQINHGRKKIHGNGGKGKTVTSLGHLGGRHLNQAGSREEGRAGSINWKNSIYCGSEVEKQTP